MIDLRRLQVLRAVAYYGTVTAAARALHLTPSAASQQVKQLGKDLGVALLEPNGRTIRLTGAAHSLLAHADAIEARWQQAEGELSGDDGLPAGLLRMAGFPTAMCRLLAPVTATLGKAYPALRVRLRETETAHCFDLLFNGSIDLAVVETVQSNPPACDRRFEQHPLLDDPFDLLVAADHRLAGRRTVELHEVAGEPWIMGAEGDTSRAQVLSACSTAGFSPDITHEAFGLTVIASLVDLGLGVALVPRLSQIQPEVDVRRIPISGTAPSRKFLTATRRGGRSTPAVAAALEALDERARSLTAEAECVAAR
ncbi:LysR family transcriptional regulator [Saccharomonospora sp. NPDC006951]